MSFFRKIKFLLPLDVTTQRATSKSIMLMDGDRTAPEIRSELGTFENLPAEDSTTCKFRPLSKRFFSTVIRRVPSQEVRPVTRGRRILRLAGHRTKLVAYMLGSRASPNFPEGFNCEKAV